MCVWFGVCEVWCASGVLLNFTASVYISGGRVPRFPLNTESVECSNRQTDFNNVFADLPVINVNTQLKAYWFHFSVNSISMQYAKQFDHHVMNLLFIPIPAARWVDRRLIRIKRFQRLHHHFFRDNNSTNL